MIALVAVGGLAGSVGAEWNITINLDGGAWNGVSHSSITYPATNFEYPSQTGYFWIDDLKNVRFDYSYLNSIITKEGYYIEGFYDSQNNLVFKGDGRLFLDEQTYPSNHGIPDSVNDWVDYSSQWINTNTNEQRYHFAVDSVSQIQDLELTVRWAPNQNPIEFNANGGSFPSGNTPTGVAYTDKTTIDELVNYRQPVREGYEFQGWADSSDGTNQIAEGDESSNSISLHKWITKPYSDSQQRFKIINDDASGDSIWISLLNESSVTLYAIWNPESTYINFDPNGGKFADDSTQQEYVSQSGGVGAFESNGMINSGDSAITLEMDVTPIREGFTFKGWMLLNDTSSTIIAGFVDQQEMKIPLMTKSYVDVDTPNKFKIDADGKWIVISQPNLRDDSVTLYALWEPVQQNNNNAAAILSSTSKYRDSVPVEYCQVFFDANGGAGEMEAQQFTVGEPRELNLNLFTYEDRPFEGWALEPLGGVVYTDGQKITVKEDTTLYAVWGIPDIEDVPVEPPTSPLGILGILGGLGAAVVLRRR